MSSETLTNNDGGHGVDHGRGIITSAHRTQKNAFQLRKRPWRRYVTPWEVILNHHYEGEGTEEKPFIVDWIKSDDNGAKKGDQNGNEKGNKSIEDAENPMTWSQAYKWFVVMSVAIATLAVAMASSTLSAATNSIEGTFGVYKQQVYVMVTSGFVLGFVVGPLLWAPMSEVFGRRNLFLFTYFFFTVFNGVVVASQNVWTLIILRFFAGTFGSSPLTNAGGTVADVFNAQQRGLGMAIFASAPFLGPAVGPIIGGFVGETVGWRWVAALIALFSALLTVVGFLAIPETYAPVLLKRRAEALSKATRKEYRSVHEKSGRVSIGSLFKTALSRPWVLFVPRADCVFVVTLSRDCLWNALHALWRLPYRLSADTRLVSRSFRPRFPWCPRWIHARSGLYHLCREPAIQQEARAGRWLVGSGTAITACHHWGDLASYRPLFIRMDSGSGLSSLDSTHHLLSALWMRYGPRLFELLQLPHRLVPPLRSFRPRCQFRPPIALWCRFPAIRGTNVPEFGHQLG